MSNIKFSQVNYPLTTLLDQIELGAIGLPDIQRPFVWSNTKIRDLFDSMYRGYPVGYFLFWQTGAETGTKQIGSDVKQLVPSMLIVDGQQRLTSLFAVLKGIPVVDENYKKRTIEIAFRPSDQQFAVGNAATRRDPEYIPDISLLWSPGQNIFSFVDTFLVDLTAYREKTGKTLTGEEKGRLQTCINQLYGLSQYPFTALVLSERAEPEEVSDVFVRINSQGATLDQADFILTLMSVYWDAGRKELEAFCRKSRKPATSGTSPFNYFITPKPDQLLRVVVGIGFDRAVLKYAYSLLRGKDLTTNKFSPERRDQQFETLQAAQKETLNVQNWHDYFKVLQQAGFRGGKMISSDMAIVYCYVFYLLGKSRFKIDKFRLADVISRWFFVISLTGRYTNSPESVMERDLRVIAGKTRDEYIEWMEETIDATFTDDFWSITLPNLLVTAAARGPYHFAYYAALNLLDARVLFSKKRVHDLLDPALRPIRAGAEKHHLFPMAHLQKLGFEQRDRNQIANYALVEWDDNNAISDSAPADYAPKYEARLSDVERAQMYFWHALPINWYEMEYAEFLKARRKLIAKVIQEGYKKLQTGKSTRTPLRHEHTPIDQIVAAGEGLKIEFKSTLRVNLHTNKTDVKIEQSALKTIAAFLNSNGGTLVIGVNDDGEALSIDTDGFPNEDKMNLHLVNIVKSRMGAEHMLHIQPRFDDFQHKRVLVVDCNPGYTPVYVKHSGTEQFFIRTGAATSELTPSQIQTYINQRF